MTVLVFSEKEDLEVDPLIKRGGNEEADVESVVVGHQLDSGGRQSHGTPSRATLACHQI
jgi:hypothetical protein